MDKKQLEKFKKVLTEAQKETIIRIEKTMSESHTVDTNELSDENDMASSDFLQTFDLRLSDREKVYLKKIEYALQKIEDGDYGICENCGEEISIKRLEARPVATLCIRCKEEQEREERTYR